MCILWLYRQEYVPLWPHLEKTEKRRIQERMTDLDSELVVTVWRKPTSPSVYTQNLICFGSIQFPNLAKIELDLAQDINAKIRIL